LVNIVGEIRLKPQWSSLKRVPPIRSRLCRYVSRPAVSEKRLSLTANGQVRYQLKTPYRDG